MRSVILALLMTMAATPARAQARVAQPGGAVRTVDYRADQIVRVEVSNGFQVMIELAADDPVKQIAIGDLNLVHAVAAKDGRQIYLQALQGSGVTNMTLVTTSRRYLFELSLIGGGPPPAYAIQFRYDAPPAADLAPPTAGYRFRGDRNLLPSAMNDNGVRTSIVWPPAVPLPAVFAVDGRGRERIVGGYMREGVYVIDAVNARLVFRIDQQAAWAQRVPLRKPGPK